MNRGFVNRCLRWMMNEMFPFYDNGELPKDLSDKVDTFYKSISSSFDWNNLTRKDFLRLGFINLDEDDTDIAPLWFIPNWLFPVIPQGLTVYDSDRKPFEFSKSTCPKDVMYGCLTFGVLEEEQDDGTGD